MAFWIINLFLLFTNIYLFRKNLGLRDQIHQLEKDIARNRRDQELKIRQRV